MLFDLINMDLWQKPILRWKQCLKIPLCLGNGEWGGGIKRKVNYVLIYLFTCSTAGTTWAGWWTATARLLAIGSSTENHRFSILTTIALVIHMWSLQSLLLLLLVAFRDKPCLWCFPFPVGGARRMVMVVLVNSLPLTFFGCRCMTRWIHGQPAPLTREVAELPSSSLSPKSIFRKWITFAN